MNMEFKRKLPTLHEIKDMYPISEESAQTKKSTDEELEKIFSGKSDRFLLVIGPCSADREDAVLEYISRLREVQEKVKDKIMIVPRIYTNKPRTTGDGYKGMLHQPDPNGLPNMLKGLIAIRKLHIKALEQTGFACADEMLYPENHQYLSDVLSYVAVGARSVENQLHRLTASGLDIPVGMKNPTGGDLSVMMNSITAAQHSHTFVYSGWEVHSKGNPYAHAILRGSSNKYGRTIPNYHYEDLQLLCELYEKNPGLQNPAVIICPFLTMGDFSSCGSAITFSTITSGSDVKRTMCPGYSLPSVSNMPGTPRRCMNSCTSRLLGLCFTMSTSCTAMRRSLK